MQLGLRRESKDFLIAESKYQERGRRGVKVGFLDTDKVNKIRRDEG